jgi:Flp pilus assembly protein TadD
MKKLMVMRIAFGLTLAACAGTLGMQFGGVLIGALAGVLALVVGTLALDRLADTVGLKLVPGQSAARFNLQSDVVRMIWMAELASQHVRKPRGIIDTRIVAGFHDAGDPARGVAPSGTWVERWQLDRSGEIVPYVITFTADGRGGTYFQVGLSVGTPAEDSEAHNQIGIDLARLGRLEGAIAEFREAIRLQPECAEAHSNLGTALRSLGRFDEAIDAYRAAVPIKPSLDGIHNNLGNALADRGHLEEAIAAFRIALRFHPGRPEVHYNLGKALRDQGKTDEAVAEFHKAREGAPLGSALAEAIERELDVTHHES